MKGNYGSFLLRQPDISVGIVQAWTGAGGVKVPVTCKIRLFDEGSPDPQQRGLQGTLNFVRELEAAGASAICVHGRNRHQKGIKTGKASWDAIARVKEVVSIPVIANGGIECYDDVVKCLSYTGADAVMSAEALLENPALFNGYYGVNGFNGINGFDRYGSSNGNGDRRERGRGSCGYELRQCGFAVEYLRYATLYPPSDFYKVSQSYATLIV
mmetsp:Transcript_3806/g.8161  ORF Transcript_3806/g.8161 Transcript_3806/m.8161 type:complete len:213 (-) Transcript_3806:365-1003(-)